MERQDHGVQIRNPSTANFLIDSRDATNGSSANFTIAKRNSLLNGFFSRIAVSEVILQWGVPNIEGRNYDNATFIITDSKGITHSIFLNSGTYTVAAALNEIVDELTALALAGYTWSIEQINGYTFLSGGNDFGIVATNLSKQLGFGLDGSSAPAQAIFNPILLPYRYIDFVSNDLTYNQSLKDATTDTYDRTVLYRWYFAWDEPTSLDEYGFPVLQGYSTFLARRALPFPKQIRWESNMPIGSVTFQLYNDQGVLITDDQASNNQLDWGMTLLVSEN